ncbi:MAG TPA: 7TM diverse intracellular signaling domain-containing protein, partial [Bacillota bacterium]|nr:7TM diverse intracellular signaling domain-containing protein [Bacillota bacterium]
MFHYCKDGNHEKKKSNLSLNKILWVPLMVMILLGVISVFSFNHYQVKAQPQIVNGILDLRGWDLRRDGPIILDGEWSFYWNRLLSLDDLEGTNTLDSNGFYKVPSAWNSYQVDNQKLLGQGYATYHLKVRMGDQPQSLAIKIPTVSTAYTVMVDHRIIATGGVVATDAKHAIGEYKPQVVSFQPFGTEFDLIVQVSNYLYNRRGMWHPFELGTTEQLTILCENALVEEMILLGSALMMGLYHIGIYLQRRKNKSALYFGIGCLIEAARLLVIEEMFILNITLSVSLKFIIFVEYITYYGGMAVFLLFFYELYPDQYSKKVVKTLLSLSGCFILTVIFSPISFYTRIVGFYHLL